jgi:aspartyl-tRNA(Asn)/glutamyl-tRNA(Gln) amidotransferase subunit B
MFRTGKEAGEIIRKKKLSRTSNAHEIRGMVKQVMTNNSEAVSDYSCGKHQALTFDTGRIMGATRGRVNPCIVAEIII